MSSAISAHGTLVARATVTIGELMDITPPSLQRNTFDTTNQNDSDESFVVGVRRKGELQFTVNFLPSGEVTHGAVSGLLKAYDTGSKDLWKITYPDNSTWSFSGYIVNISPKAPVDGALQADITVRPTNAFVFTP